LSTHLKEKVEKIEEILSNIVEESTKNKPIIVEGKKDTETLRDLGIKGDIFTLKTGGKSFLEATTQIEELGVEEVILLLDFDRRGKEGTKRLQDHLEIKKIKTNVRFWHELNALVGREIQCIESLTKYLETLHKKLQVRWKT
jgi:5S rRNA maturation endonuclease (ribonuclease M5)